MIDGLVLTTAPTVEPVSLAEAKLHLRVTTGDDDQAIASMIKAARQLVEQIVDKVFLEQVWTLTLNEFPSEEYIELPVSPLLSITSITYTNTSGTTGQSFSSSYYLTDTTRLPGRAVLKYSYSWPDTYDQDNVIAIVFKAGYGTAATSVPECIKTAILYTLELMYNGQAIDDAARQTIGAIAGPERMWRFE
jgi:uncharacterized phiE125 gp8 family phage protein